jgi:hypothetical protein
MNGQACSPVFFQATLATVPTPETAFWPDYRMNIRLLYGPIWKCRKYFLG